MFIEVDRECCSYLSVPVFTLILKYYGLGLELVDLLETLFKDFGDVAKF